MAERRKKIVIHTNSPTWKTGLGENGRYLAEYLYKTGKYDIVYYCSQVNEQDPSLNTMPWKAYGAIPPQHVLAQVGNDPGKMRDIHYGSHNIDKVIETEKPDIYWGSDDVWAFGGYTEKPWWDKINAVLHATVDSRPIMGQAFEQAKKTKHYTLWSEFASKEMLRVGPDFSHVKTVYGCFDTNDFRPLSRGEKMEWRKKMGINPKTTVFLMVNRNQLRKGFNQAIAAFAEFKRENPKVDAKLYFHTAFGEKGNGFDLAATAKYYGVKDEDMLCTYVCKNCGGWHVAPYKGEDQDCPLCKASKTCITPTIVHGVPDSDMKYVHGIADAGLSIFTSGGLERFTVTSLLSGLYTAVTNYTCGEDFCAQPFVYALNWNPTFEAQTNFIKAATSIQSIKAFMAKVQLMSQDSRDKVGKQGREWAARTFSIETVGKQWDEMFDTMPLVDWSKIQLTYKAKNEAFPMPPDNLSDVEFVSQLYANILYLPEPEGGEGHRHWQEKLKTKALTREQIWRFFTHEAKKENGKHAKPADFLSLLDDNERKRSLFLIKESIGDIMLVTSLFKSHAEQYPEADLYVMCEEKYHEVLAGNPHIHRLLPYNAAFENEMVALGAGGKERAPFDYYFAPAIQTQVRLGYLGRKEPAFQL